MYTVYCCNDNENNFKYIGITKRDLILRLKAHYHEAKYGLANSPFKIALRKGKKFNVSVLNIVDNVDKARELEKYYIQLYRTYIGFKDCKGYNGTLGGEHCDSNFGNQINMYSLEGKLIRSFECTVDAALFMGTTESSISKACKNIQYSCKGYVFRYNGEPFDKYKPYKRKSKRVIQYDLNMSMVNTYNSIGEAAKLNKFTFSSIQRACASDSGYYNGYFWRIHPEDVNIVNNVKLSVLQFDLDWNLIAKYISVQEASEKTGLNRVTISRCCSGKTENAAGYIWRYE